MSKAHISKPNSAVSKGLKFIPKRFILTLNSMNDTVWFLARFFACIFSQKVYFNISMTVLMGNTDLQSKNAVSTKYKNIVDTFI